MRSTFFRILGHGDGATAYNFCTRRPDTLPGTWTTGTTVPILLNAPSVVSNDLQLLDTIGTSGSVTVGLLWDGTQGGAAVAPLVAADATPVADTSGGFVRLSRYHGPAETTLDVHDSGSIATGYYFIGGECVQVTGSTSTTLTVTRGRRGTWGVPIPYSAAYGGTPVYDQLPSAEGQWCELGVVEGGTETVLWRGVVDEVSLDGTTVTLSCMSLMQILRDAEVATPTALSVPSWPGLSAVENGELVGFDAAGGGMLVDADLYGDPDDIAGVEWEYVKIFNAADEWVIVACTHVLSFSVLGRRIAQYTVDLTSDISSVLAGGIGSTALQFDSTAGRGRRRFVQDVLRGAVRGELAQTSSGNLLAILRAFVLAGDIAGASLPLNPASGSGAWTAQTVASSRNGLVSLANDWYGTLHFLPSYDGKLSKALEELYLAPFRMGLTERDGQILLVDWLPSIDQASMTTIDGTDSATKGYRWQSRATEAVPVVALRQAIKTRSTELVPITLPTVSGVPLTVQITEATEDEEVIVRVSPRGAGPRGFAGVDIMPVIGLARNWPEVIRRAEDVVGTYDRPLPVVEVTLQGTADSSALQTGELCFVSRPDLPLGDGTRGASTLRGMVTRLSRSLRSDSYTATIVVIDWYLSQLAVGVWGPCAVVASWAAGPTQASVEANEYTTTTAAGALPTTDAEAFADLLSALGTSVSVDLIDETGDYRDTGTLTSATAAGKMVVTGLTATPVAGDRFVLSDASTVAASVLSTTVTRGPVAYLADSSGDVRGGTQAGRVYS